MRNRRWKGSRAVRVGIVSLLVMAVLPPQRADAAPSYHYEMKFQSDFRGADHLFDGWDFSGSGRVVFPKRQADWYYDLHVANADGTNESCLTCDKPFLPNRHMGTAYWMPGGQFIVFTAERAVHGGNPPYCHEPWCGSYGALPGYGAYNDVWIIRSDGTQAWKLTDIPEIDTGEGQIIPSVSPNGLKIMWNYRSQGADPFASDWRVWGRWQIKVANLTWSGGSYGVGNPSATGIQTYEPGFGLNEANSFSRDSSQILFSSSMSASEAFDLQIYSVNVAGFTGLKNLTNNGHFNEHPMVTADGSKLVYMSGEETSNDSDWWIMDLAGTNRQRLSYINEDWHPQWTGSPKLNGNAPLAPDMSYPIRFKSTQFVSPFIYQGLIKQGTITRRSAGTGTGLRGEYFSDPFLTPANLVLTRTDPHLSFIWRENPPGTGETNSPAPGIVPSNGFSSKWTGKVQAYPGTTGWHTFRCVHDDGCQVWVNNQLVIDSWAPFPGVHDSGWIWLVGGTKYDIKVQHYEGTGDAELRLAWTGWGTGANFDWEIVPKTQLYLT